MVVSKSQINGNKICLNIIEDYYTERKMVGDGSRYSDIFVVMNMKIFMIEDDYTERKMVGNESRYSDIFMVINMKIFMRPHLTSCSCGRMGSK